MIKVKVTKPTRLFVQSGEVFISEQEYKLHKNSGAIKQVVEDKPKTKK